MSPADEMAAKPDAAGSGEESDEKLGATLEDLQRVGLQWNPVEEDGPVKRDDLRPGITSYLDQEASERKAIYDRLVAIENETKRRGSRGFARYLVAILIGVAATLAWQSYRDAAREVIATRAPELGWSPEVKQMMASWVQQLGWTKSPAGSEKQAVLLAQTAPAAPSIDPGQVQQMARDLSTLRQTVEQLAAGQGRVTQEIDQVTQEIAKLEVADVEILAKITPAPAPPRPIAAPTHKPTPVPPTSSREAPRSSRTPIPTH